MSSTEAVMEPGQGQQHQHTKKNLLERSRDPLSTRFELEELKASIDNFLKTVDNSDDSIELLKLSVATTERILEKERQEKVEVEQTLEKEKQENVKNIRLIEIQDGIYFSALDEVWTSQKLRFDNVDVLLFDRPSSVVAALSNIGMTYYKSTMEVTEAMLEVDSKCSSRSGSSSSQRGCPDIFGSKRTAQNAHLMPHSANDAKKWQLIVPGVLSDEARRKDSETIMKMFINGFIEPSDDTSKRMKRSNNSGIKNFPTNKIRLVRQAEFFDTYHCLLIIPILQSASIKNWNGDGYDAIVLVAERPKMEDSPAMVYQNIGACKDPRDDEHILATPKEIAICRKSLEELILVVVKSFYDHATVDVERSKDDVKTLEKLACGFVSTPCDLSDSYPRRVRKTRRVRKIRFIDSHQNNNNKDFHKAPDPMLLLSKAVSNWLHIQDYIILPSIENDTTSETTSMSPYDSKEDYQYVVYNSTRGPNHPPVEQRLKYVDNPPVTEIAFIHDGDFSVSSDFK